MQNLLFFSRLTLYIIMICAPFWLKPSIAVAYDRVSFVAWFIIVPLNMFIAYFLHQTKLKSKNTYVKLFAGQIYSILATLILTIGFSDFEFSAVLLFFTLAISSFWLTRFVFYSERTSVIVISEILFFSFVYFKFLNFTRSTPEISEQHPIYAKLLLLLLILSFLFHIAIIYLAAFPDKNFRKKRKEFLIFTLIVIPFFAFLTLILPADFVKHQISFNKWNEDPPPDPKEIEREGDGMPSHGIDGRNKLEKHNRNGKPLGERDEKYPSELQGGEGGGSSSHGREGGSGGDQENLSPKKTLPEEKEKHTKSKKNKGKKGNSQKQNKEKNNEGESSQGGGSSSQGGGSSSQGGGSSSQGGGTPSPGGGSSSQGGGTPSPGGGSSSQGGDTPSPGGGGEGRENKNNNNSASKKQPKLEGVPSEDWDNYTNRANPSQGGGSSSQGGGSSSQGGGSSSQGGGSSSQGGGTPSLGGGGGNDSRSKSGSGEGGKQNSVMIVASKTQPIYSAEGYWGTFAEDGFSASKDNLEPLNKLKNQQLVETWQDNFFSKDDKREVVPLFFLSTIKDRVLPYRPFKIQPTIENKKSHPFDLSYQVQSRISISQPEDWYLARDLNLKEKQIMEPYLDTKNLAKKYKLSFKKHLNEAKIIFNNTKTKFKLSARPDSYFEKIEIILRGYAKHRYEMGFDDQMTLDKLNNFIAKDKKGDCTVFSQSAAILGRLMGVPSRVVVGYLASKDLQTPTHVGALYHLREKISALQKFPLEELFLVTTSHHHSWVQFFIPNFGWVDFETTSYALPPPKGKDPNDMDVVIPLIDENKPLKEPTFTFPYKLMFKLLAYMALSFFLVLYLIKYLYQLFLYFKSKSGGDVKIRVLQMRLLIFLANEGYILKPNYLTTIEFAEKIPLIKDFAEIYTTLRFKTNYDDTKEKEELLNKLQFSFNETLRKSKRKGFKALVYRYLGLRSLYYL